MTESTQPAESTEAVMESTEATAENTDADDTVVRVASLKGPTSLGLLFLMDKAEKGETFSYGLESDKKITISRVF